jgi:hypothetical protein
LLRLRQIREDLHGPLVERAPALSEADPSRGAIEKAGLEVGFQFSHLTGSRGGREPEAPRGARKASRFNDLRKYADAGESIHYPSIRLN